MHRSNYLNISSSVRLPLLALLALLFLGLALPTKLIMAQATFLPAETLPEGITIVMKCSSESQVSADISINLPKLWDYNLHVHGVVATGISSRNIPQTVNKLDHNKTYTADINNWEIGSIPFTFTTPDCSRESSSEVTPSDDTISSGSDILNDPLFDDKSVKLELAKQMQAAFNGLVNQVEELLAGMPIKPSVTGDPVTAPATREPVTETLPGGITIVMKCSSESQVSADISINRPRLVDYNLHVHGVVATGISSRNIPQTVNKLDHNKTYTADINNWNMDSIPFTFTTPNCATTTVGDPPVHPIELGEIDEETRKAFLAIIEEIKKQIEVLLQELLSDSE